LHFADTKPHALRVEYAHRAELFGAGITLNWQPPVEPLRAEAVQAAQQADAVVAFVGLSPEIEGEEMPVHVPGFAGGDRTEIALPQAQEQLLEAVAATGKPLVVVLMNGSALAIPWAKQHAAAILEAWYPGEAGGQAIAETLAGKSNPAGRLPVTFYASSDQLPPFTDYSMKNRTYRYFQGEPLYAFGYGLSYTHFSYSEFKLDRATYEAGEAVTAQVSVRNDGERDGDEVVELYLSGPGTTGPAVTSNPVLRGLERIHLAKGEEKPVRFRLSARDVSTVDTQGRRSVQPGSYTLSVGGGQPAAAAHVSGQFSITGSAQLQE
jgi:beta-glucosidase